MEFPTKQISTSSYNPGWGISRPSNLNSVLESIAWEAGAGYAAVIVHLLRWSP